MPASGGGDAVHFARPTPSKAYAYGYAYETNVTIFIASLKNRQLCFLSESIAAR